MKTLKTIIFVTLAILFSNRSAFADSSVFFTSFQLVNQQLNSDIFSFKNKLINFTMSEDSAQISILNNICPRLPGRIQCKAMPIPVLSAVYQLQLVEIDQCGVKTYISNQVEKPSTQANVSETTTLVIKDNRQSVCEILYSAQFYVKLVVTKTNLESGAQDSFTSYMGFNQPKLFKNEAKGFTATQ